METAVQLLWNAADCSLPSVDNAGVFVGSGSNTIASAAPMAAARAVSSAAKELEWGACWMGCGASVELGGSIVVGGLARQSRLLRETSQMSSPSVPNTTKRPVSTNARTSAAV